ncbi:hypothetical protein ACHRVW_02435 [Flavobacterium collinsii]|uniref:hypothetical protein n=1 Tax=Flavobacterium collinsii TaxID=1114861 RepID=UPI003758279C
MKKTYLFAMLFAAFISCSKDDSSTENVQLLNKKTETLNFSSYEMMDKKIDEITSIKEKMETSTAKKYINENNVYDKSTESETLILNNLKKYHIERLNDIYELRKELNFISIQSIADEINSLNLINSQEANKLLAKYKSFLFQDNYEIKTVFEDRTANVINEDGDVLIDGIPTNFKLYRPNNPTGKYVNDEYIRAGTAAVSKDLYFKVDFFAGREKHRDTFGRTFFRYYTEFKAYYIDLRTGIVSLCPATFNVDPSSIAGFSQTRSMPFSEFAFSIPYPSGNGSSIRYTGGQKWTAYQPEGGSIEGTFTGAGRIATCNFRYIR